MSDPAPITIRRPRPDDAAAIAATMSDPLVARGLMQLPFADASFWHKRIVELPGGATHAELFIVAERAGQVVGNAGLTPNQALRRRHAMSLGIAVSGADQRQGVGSALMAALIDWADHWAQVLRLELTVYADNARAIALYQRFGFELEGRLRGFALREGEFVDALAMARLHPKPPRIGAWAGA